MKNRAGKPWWVPAWWPRHDVERGEVVDRGRWFQCGLLTENGVPQASYFILRLPSWTMQPSWYERVPCWHQMVLLWREPLAGPYGSGDGLRFDYFECRE